MKIPADLGDQERLCTGVTDEQNFEMDRIFVGLIRGEHSPVARTA